MGLDTRLGPELLRSLGAKVIAIGINPNGLILMKIVDQLIQIKLNCCKKI